MSGKEYELVNLRLFRSANHVICSYRLSTPSNNSLSNTPSKQNMRGKLSRIERDHPKCILRMKPHAKKNFLDRVLNQTIR